MNLAIAREYLDLVKFHHTLFALPFALLGAALAAWSPDGWRAGRRTGWESSCAWPRPARPRWPSTGWWTATTTP